LIRRFDFCDKFWATSKTDDLLGQLRDDVFGSRLCRQSEGDVVELAAATPLDFAYHVHTRSGIVAAEIQQ
jgi:(p)ppGpp synthase/HD superfamily hydrolase